MSKTKAGGSAKNLKDSPGQRLGVKRFGGQKVTTGSILVRQRGMTKTAGPGTKVGRDYTIYAAKDGEVTYKKTQVTHFTGRRVPRTEVSIKD